VTCINAPQRGGAGRGRNVEPVETNSRPGALALRRKLYQDMDPVQSLIPYGYLVIAIMAGFVLIPHLRGKSDLLTAWNILLVGCAIFTGLGCLSAAYREFYWQQLFFRPTPELVSWYLKYSAAFYIALFITYYYNPVSVPLASRSLQKWPAFSLPLVLYVLAISFMIIMAAFAVGNRAGFIGPIARNLAHKAAVFSTVFAFALWYRDKRNAAYLALFLSVLVVASLYAMWVFVGRRLLLGVALGPIVYAYWVTVRYWRTRAIIAMMGAAAVAIFMIGSAYATFRHFSYGVRGRERSIGNIVQQVRTLDVRGLIQTSFGQVLNLPQQNVQYSMLVRRSIEQHVTAPKPLNTLALIVTYPIPRAFWAGKPRTIGDLMPKVVLRLGRRGLNWGVGPPGHGAFEGGIPALVLYAALVSFGIRFLDEPLKRQPSNPFLIAILASAAPHILGFARGDFFIMSIETIECFVFALFVGIGGRLLFGTERYPERNLASGAANAYGRFQPQSSNGWQNVRRYR
jgi:hypothetical protein